MTLELLFFVANTYHVSSYHIKLSQITLYETFRLTDETNC